MVIAPPALATDALISQIAADKMLAFPLQRSTTRENQRNLWICGKAPQAQLTVARQQFYLQQNNT